LLTACTAALSAALFAAPCQAGSLGRLFFTPGQRAEMEQARARNMVGVGNGAQKDQEDASAVPEEEKHAPSVLTVEGIVQKRGGARTVWINGVAQSADGSGERAPDSLTVTVPGKAQPVRVKVGQRLVLEPPPPPKVATQSPVHAGGEDD
jgi:hypothetical protein